MFKKKKKINEEEIVIEDIDETEMEEKAKEKKILEKKKNKTLKKGQRTLKELIIPAIDRKDPNCLKINNTYSKTFAVEGYPTMVSLYWLNDLIGTAEDIDTNVFIYPVDKKTAKDAITNELTQKQSQYSIERKNGSIGKLTELEAEIDDLISQRVRIERGIENFFHTSIFFTIHASSKKDLDKKAKTILNNLKGSDILPNPTEMRQSKSYEAALPIATLKLTEFLRNMNTGSVSACFPFYNSEITHKNGVFFGKNKSTGSPAFLDMFDPSEFENANFNLIGMSGSGKSFFLTLLIWRHMINGIRSVVVDPEGEYEGACKAAGGTYVKIAPGDFASSINPLDLGEEVLEDGTRTVDIKSKIADTISLIAIMNKGLSAVQESEVSTLLLKIYQDFGFSDDPQSLYKEVNEIDEEGIFRHGKVMKNMPTLSDLFLKMQDYLVESPSDELKSVYDAMKMYVNGGIYDMFDCQTSDDIKNLKDSPFIVFDVSKLEANTLRPLGMYIALSWIWESYVKKMPKIRKMVVLDEAWMLTNKALRGHEFTSYFIGTMSRRIRKRNASLVLASQKFEEFAENEHAKAALTNAALSIFLAQQSKDIASIQREFLLSHGEMDYLLKAKKGEALLRSRHASSAIDVFAFPFEAEIIEKNKPINK